MNSFECFLQLQVQVPLKIVYLEEESLMLRNLFLYSSSVELQISGKVEILRIRLKLDFSFQNLKLYYHRLKIDKARRRR